MSSASTRINYLVQQFKKIPQLTQALISVFRPRAWGPFLNAYKRTKFDHDFTVSWSQCGEDLALVSLLGASDRRGTYVDVGAHHPDRFSVTRALYELGWSGVHVDADKGIESEFRKKRPRDKFIFGAIGTKDSYTFYKFKERAISTVNESWRDKYASAGLRIEAVEDVPGLSLRSIFESLREQVDFLNIDIEGADLDAIKSLELDLLSHNLWPEWIMVESAPPIAQVISTESVSHLMSKGYEIWTIMPMATILRKGN